jgi:tyrosinase
MDWEDPPSSPIFDSETGFGGDGDPDAPKHNTAHCVTDMPLETDLQPLWYGGEYEPYCLTRAFTDENWLGHYVNPDALEEVKAAKSYDEFFPALEAGPHNVIIMGIGGDIAGHTAPNGKLLISGPYLPQSLIPYVSIDPLFYLHHSQLDRIWWLWQLRDKENRIYNHDSMRANENVTLSDTIPLVRLDRDLTVADILDTEGGEMCYRYMYN